MKRDYKKIWWDQTFIKRPEEEENLTFKDLALGLLFCAGCLVSGMAAFWIKGVYFG